MRQSLCETVPERHPASKLSLSKLARVWTFSHRHSHVSIRYHCTFRCSLIVFWFPKRFPTWRERDNDAAASRAQFSKNAERESADYLRITVLTAAALDLTKCLAAIR